eukprot:1151365-Pelagomonas_calceolata.AAC.5
MPTVGTQGHFRSGAKTLLVVHMHGLTAQSAPIHALHMHTHTLTHTVWRCAAQQDTPVLQLASCCKETTVPGWNSASASFSDAGPIAKSAAASPRALSVLPSP